ncbi:hypothetical protein VF14_15430 [Nostoc linckia z18]|uniref:Uncharacterized protein n=1 Tax=Nostoc linckia z7 TaxID=1628745 RepID=A0ABX4KPD2_NOSLI|nr:hypothetical protein VF05_27300 [Nostoc linckia z3]PHJ68418.1 hypothetical protein VF03_24700 [Nostoc linckia z2]PHJ83488.1 hypothetical protein VF07_26300 [Nostoc linckia z6]PHJ95741.1 hypothetical protein VF04_18270 [Nostoc linckia z7]PHK16526.1 hypothetical protein VF10_27370 [Nostoc linckia z13]PHK33932.1 hypothetical protein VF14_15430 [Nostoc linckia z18]
MFHTKLKSVIYFIETHILFLQALRSGVTSLKCRNRFYCGMGVLTRPGGQDAIGVHLSLNSCATAVLPHPSIPWEVLALDKTGVG